MAGDEDVETAHTLIDRLTVFAADLDDRERAILLSMARCAADPIGAAGRRPAASLLTPEQERLLEELIEKSGP